MAAPSGHLLPPLPMQVASSLSLSLSFSLSLSLPPSLSRYLSLSLARSFSLTLDPGAWTMMVHHRSGGTTPCKVSPVHPTRGYIPRIVHHGQVMSHRPSWSPGDHVGDHHPETMRETVMVSPSGAALLPLCESTNPPGHLLCDKWTSLSGPLSLWDSGHPARDCVPRAFTLRCTHGRIMGSKGA